MTRKVRTGAAVVLLISAIVVLALAVIVYRRGSGTSQRSYTRVVKQHDIVDAARNALAALSDAEISEQNYILTGETTYSEAYAQDIRDWQDESGTLDLVVIKDPAAAVAKEFSQSGTRVINELALVVSLYEKSGRDAALERIRKGAGKVYLDQARESVVKILMVDGGSADETRRIVISAVTAIHRLVMAAALLFLITAIGAGLLFLQPPGTP